MAEASCAEPTDAKNVPAVSSETPTKPEAVHNVSDEGMPVEEVFKKAKLEAPSSEPELPREPCNPSEAEGNKQKGFSLVVA